MKKRIKAKVTMRPNGDGTMRVAGFGLIIPRASLTGERGGGVPLTLVDPYRQEIGVEVMAIDEYGERHPIEDRDWPEELDEDEP